ncbi:MAG: hypothetical protein JJU02_12935 [Cryomorphaceae bacterium]|nr:hypothetical protein [Cryomorphaceae bacterium]
MKSHWIKTFLQIVITGMLVGMPLLSNAQAFGFFRDRMYMPQGSRAVGLGGAYTAVANDATAIFWNPGALGQLNGTSMSFTGIGQSRIAELEMNPGSQFSALIKNNSQFHGGLNQGAIAIPIFIENANIQIVPAISYHQQDNYQGFREEWIMEYYEGSEWLDYNMDFNFRGGMHSISAGLGLQVGDHVGLGVVYNSFIGTRREHLDLEMTGNTISNETAREYLNARLRGGGYTFGLKITSSDFRKNRFHPNDDYKDGFDFGLTIDLPHQHRMDIWDEDIPNDTTYRIMSQPMRLRTGIAIRADNILWSTDFSYTNFDKARTSEPNANDSWRTVPEGINLMSISTGLEISNVLRFGFMARNYQFLDADKKQPWTTSISMGLSIGENDTFIWDITGSMEFFNWEDLNVGPFGDSFTYKGTMFTLMTSFRILIPN